MSQAERATRGVMRTIDDRLGSASFLKKQFNKAFPDHWSFMLGEIALYSFIILLLTGTYLALFFHASQKDVIYNGTYVPLRGLKVSDAYNSTLHISFDVRGGLLIRQIHHWSALLFVASITVHMCRIFFTGAFRKPREINWLIGIGLLTLGILEGFAGYSLPDDLLSGTGLRIAYGVLESIPIVGSYAAMFVFGGQFPGNGDFIPRLFIVHVLLIPGILLALITAHLMMIWHQKHTDFPGYGKSEHTVTGTRLWPAYALKGQGYLFIVFGVCALLGTFAQINPIWLYGPYNPAQVSAGSQPDFYMLFLEGSLRMMPPWEWNFWGHTIPFNVLVPAVVLPGILFTGMALWPWIERFATKDKREHNVLDRPRNAPVRTACGVAALTLYLVLYAAGQNDLIAVTFHISLQATTWIFRVCFVVLPPIAFYYTRRICLGLQQRDADKLSHGWETGRIKMLPSGEFLEVHAPVPEARRPVLATGNPEAAAALESGHDGHDGDGHHGGNGHGPIIGSPVSGGPANGGGRRANLLTSAQRRLANFFTEQKVAPADQPEPPQTLGRPEE